MAGKTIGDLQKGDTASFSKTISEADIYLFAGVTGDFNPAHIDEQYAKGTFFKTRIAHGSLLAGFISTVMGTMLPGPGTVYVRQELNFLAPARIGDTTTAVAEVLEIDAAKNRVHLRTFCRNQDAVILVDGTATVSPPKRPKEK
ncbi:MAG: MaoC family dehydratase [Desulfarculus sp.]|nr:MaoC family dehydratase [Desulfarculus sp.]